MDNPGDDGSFRQVSYQVMKQSGKSKGSLNFSYKVGEHVPAPAPKAPKTGQEPVMAYPPTGAGSSSMPYGTPHPPPPPPVAGSGGYGYPPQQAYGGYPPQQGYGYPPQAAGYGYPQHQSGYGYPQQPGYGYPPQAQKPKKNKFGMGLGAGLLGGALGGMLIGDMVSDAADYDAGYDAGFDDAGGFDF